MHDSSSPLRARSVIVVRILLLGLVTLQPSAVVLNAQTIASDSAIAREGQTSGHVMTRIGITTLVMTGVLMPLDRTIAHGFRSVHGTGSDPVDRVTPELNWFGESGVVIVPVTLMAAGWTMHNPTVRDAGAHAAEAVVLSSGMAALLKGVVGRERPSANANDSDEFRLHGGFARRGSTSFPSGHTTAAFALATVLTTETARSYPSVARAVRISTFGLASGVGLARVYTNHHWASDVTLGAGLGMLTGLVVEHWANDSSSSHQRLPGWLVPRGIVPGGRRAMMTWQIPVTLGPQ